MKDMPLKDRLIVAADFRPPRRDGQKAIRKKVLALARALRPAGVCIKLNSILRACGYELIDEIHQVGLSCFADLKICDIERTMEYDGAFLKAAGPKFVTVMYSADFSGMMALRRALPKTEVLSVTSLSSDTNVGIKNSNGVEAKEFVERNTRHAMAAALDGVVTSVKDVSIAHLVTKGFVVTINAVGVRPISSKVRKDDQDKSRSGTPTQAMQAGADRVIVGRPVTQSRDPYSRVMRILEEIESALSKPAQV